MGYYEYLCELLRPLGVYALGEDTLSGAELAAAGEGLDAAAEALDIAERESVLATAEDEGLVRRERLFTRLGVRTTPELRRLAVASLAGIGADGFTLAEIDRALSGCGIRAAVEETGTSGTVRVRFPKTGGEPEGFERIREVILDILPCHLAVEFVFRYLTWAECEARGATWASIEAANHSWESFLSDVPGL